MLTVPASRVQVLLWARDDRMDLTQVSLGMDFFFLPSGKESKHASATGACRGGGSRSACFSRCRSQWAWVRRQRCAKVPRGPGGVGAARRRTGVCPPAGSGVQRECRRESGFLEVSGAAWGFAGLSCASVPLRDAATVVSQPESEACGSPTSSPLRLQRGPGGPSTFRGLILALASWGWLRPPPPAPPRPAPPPPPRSGSRGRGRGAGWVPQVERSYWR